MKQSQKKEKKVSVVMKKIIDAEEINDDNYKVLEKKQEQQNLKEEEKYQMAKYLYNKTFGVNFDDVEFLKKFYNKLSMVRNAKSLFNETKINLDNSSMKNKEKITKVLKVRELLQMIGVNYTLLMTEDIAIDINNDNKRKEINTFFQNNKILFGFNKTINLKSNQSVLGTLKALLCNYGLSVETHQTKEKMDDKWKTVSHYKIGFYSEVKDKLNEKNDKENDINKILIPEKVYKIFNELDFDIFDEQ
jgi:hypothetical protein